MKKLAFCFVILLMSMVARADEVITVSAKNSDISANLDLKVVAKLFGEAKNLEEFEMMLNNPDSAFVNLDLNGDGQVDYIRVIETHNGSQHLIVLQSVLAVDIYQDVATIFVEKDEATNQVSVQVIGDEYLYGSNYIIEPVYVYRPVIYDWFWSPYWTCWNSPWYWGYYPLGWRPWACVPVIVYIDRCHYHCQQHTLCSFRYTQTARPSSRTMGEGVRRNDFAQAQPQRAFAARNSGVTNARQLENSARATATTARRPVATARPAATAQRATATTATRAKSTTTAQRAATTTQRSSTSTAQRATTTTQRATTTTQRASTSTAQRATTTTQRSSTTATRTPTATNSSQRVSTSTRTTSSYPSGTYSGGSSRSGGSMGGGSMGGGSSRSGGGASTRR
ncbi:MAG: hypothetical protein MJZ53_01920 [Paludibacteraceae bacterium]|nr:hypothetical protein [Paludibacteraceae bacterium]